MNKNKNFTNGVLGIKIEFSFEGIFGKYSKVKIFVKCQILMPFSPSKLKKISKKLRVGYVYIEESFDTIFNMGYMGCVQRL